MAFDNELEFEQSLINLLFEKGWEREVIKYPTEEDLIQNWADILFKNNSGIDQLNDVPLSENEMQQLIEQITKLRSPLALNEFINGKGPAGLLPSGKRKRHRWMVSWGLRGDGFWHHF